MGYYEIKYSVTVTEAPQLTKADLLTLTEAASQLNVAVQTVNYYISIGKLSAIMAEGDYTAHRRPRRFVLKKQVDTLIVDQVQEAFQAGTTWLRKAGLWFKLPVLVADSLRVKGSQATLLRQMTLGIDETGDWDIDARAFQTPGNGQDTCTIQVEVQSESRWPDLSGVAITLHCAKPAAGGQPQTTITNQQGRVRFERVPVAALDQVYFQIQSSGDAQPASPPQVGEDEE